MRKERAGLDHQPICSATLPGRTVSTSPSPSPTPRGTSRLPSEVLAGRDVAVRAKYAVELGVAPEPRGERRLEQVRVVGNEQFEEPI
jgi:hypothetical protein